MFGGSAMIFRGTLRLPLPLAMFLVLGEEHVLGLMLSDLCEKMVFDGLSLLLNVLLQVSRAFGDAQFKKVSIHAQARVMAA